MAEKTKPTPKPTEPRAFEAALEASLANLRLTHAGQPAETIPAPAVPQQLVVQPPQPEVLSRLVNFIKKI